ncbi:branched-chain amino acid ABC transporter permease [Erwinia sp. OLTSP20]|uniref:AzlC family ABC transporter permease n=1 Tax=unclassified Erwinia TaxID=2622719 RepID=UPI000C1936D4|nr:MULTISPECIES: AzlC family ABC transporter permease [unclassified Erwinia]PIJ51366.1 branched-chain amino acid ABC transporter permease [Erwinia sp. OAMSP11]PIJ74150.1 branched-chain amino acid ABC transporter permease [Erwinia sp. OLSSP12]PIJ81560.1 branched-chain amino acid ABC transporter permease [Erwinia sp. OLCASP19]PIJ86113.1 branched-chain amino acid ABC transporter permease [Erwinia sp. OLMTSP26]PIJ87861.1 branched-chain amino acid ABC transporter permease [Erwinia sp. OLMDSP33]
MRVRYINKKLLKSILLICLADGIFGLSYGSTATSYGFPLWVAAALSVLVLAGASEFLFVTIVGGGGSIAAAVVAGLLVNARHLPFGMAVKDLIGRSATRYLGYHIMNDESVVVGLAQKSPRRARAAFWLCGMGIFLIWPLCVVLGGVIGQIIPDPASIGLDAVFPAILLALTLQALKNRQTLISALSGVTIALILSPFLPVGLPVLCALSGLLIRDKTS